MAILQSSRNYFLKAMKSSVKMPLLAVGIPTYRRPERAISLIRHLLKLEIYDQIIVASNSYEAVLAEYLKPLSNDNKVTFLQQSTNQGIAGNYASIVKLCCCKYLHIISDEDSIYPQAARKLYGWLGRPEQPALVVVTVNDQHNNPYKNAFNKKNRFLTDPLGDTAHIGSCVFEVGSWKPQTFQALEEYCYRDGAAYPTTASALLSYSHSGGLAYFGEPVVKMGEVDVISDVKGHRSYGMLPKLNQFLSILELLGTLKFKSKLRNEISIYYYFSHHGLQDSYRKFAENIFAAISALSESRGLSKSERMRLLLLVSWYFYFKLYYRCKTSVGRILSVLGKRTKE